MGLLEFKKALVDSKILTNDEYLALKVENATTMDIWDICRSSPEE